MSVSVIILILNDLKGKVMFEDNHEGYMTLDDLNNLLDSEASQLSMVLDSVDGTFDGMVQAEVLNQWRTSKGLAPDNFESDVLPILDAIKYITDVQKNELSVSKFSL